MVESVKAASDVYCPVAGEVVAVNDAIDGEPSLINEDAAGKRLAVQGQARQPRAKLDALMDEAAYAEFLKTLA